jgi:hypothetical protein
VENVSADRGIDQFVESLKGQPVFIGMQAEGREWPQLFSNSLAPSASLIDAPCHPG